MPLYLLSGQFQDPEVLHSSILAVQLICTLYLLKASPTHLAVVLAETMQLRQVVSDTSTFWVMMTVTDPAVRVLASERG